MTSMSETILLVYPEEDQYVGRFKTHFEEKGATVIHVVNFDEAYQVLESQHVDIITVDMDISYDSAFKFCFRVKKNPNLSNIFIIALADAHERFGIYMHAVTLEEKKWLNIDLWVNKPISAKHLYLLLKKEIAIFRRR